MAGFSLAESSFSISAALLSTAFIISWINPSRSLSSTSGSTVLAISVIVLEISELTSSKLSGSSYAALYRFFKLLTCPITCSVIVIV